MALPYEILIRSTDGNYSGAQVLDTPTSPARAIKAEDWPAIVKDINKESAAALQAAKLDADAKIKEAADKAAEEITKVNEALAASGKALADAKATADTLKDQLESGKAVLAEHQKISDDLANRAEAAMASGDLAALPAIIADAKSFGAAREKKKIIEEADALEKQADALEDKALELRERANKL